jgi:outer membrane protein assembly factor BamB
VNISLTSRRTFSRAVGATLLFIGLLVLSGCSALVLPEGWAGLTADGTLVDGRYQDARYVYVAYRNVIFRIDTTKSPDTKPEERIVDWAAVAPNNGTMFAAPALGPDGKLYVGSYNHTVYAFSPQARPPDQPIAGFQVTPGADKVIADAAVNNGRVYVGQGDKGIVELDPETGAVIARYTDTRYGIWSAPAFDNEKGELYVGSLDQRLYALRTDDLSYIWELELGGAIGATPLLYNGVLYVGTFGNELVAVDPSSNPPKVINRFKTRGWVWSTPVAHDGALYFGDLKGYVYALDIETFQLRWEATDTEHPGGIRGKVAVVDGKVIAGSESKYLRAYDEKTGSVHWTSGTPATDRILSDLIVIGPDVIFTTLNENTLVVAHNIERGFRSWYVAKPSNELIAQLATQAPR